MTGVQTCALPIYYKAREILGSFARELEAVLVVHHQSLNAFELRLGIAEEKARRLQQSLLTPGSLPVLAPEELNELELKLPLISMLLRLSCSYSAWNSLLPASVISKCSKRCSELQRARVSFLFTCALSPAWSIFPWANSHVCQRMEDLFPVSQKIGRASCSVTGYF